jgi:Spy/CpxP family protein refolding chaperone
MTRTKSLALVFYLGAALAGAAVGAAADRVSVRSPSGPPDPHSSRNRLFDQLHLTGVQRDSATVMYDERDKKLGAIMDKYKASLDPWRAEQDSVFTEYRQRLSRLLTPEQQAIWDQMRREREKAQRTEKK